MAIFRILIVDDQLTDQLVQAAAGSSAPWNAMVDLIRAATGGNRLFVARTLVDASEDADCHLYIAKDLLFGPGSVVFRRPENAPDFDLQKPLHAAVLDLKGVKLGQELRLV